ncbi:hypothetical protein CEP51_000600 [Fusarium floridanum]|uniref:Uncharacterized protein n=1 Tax=Fusarium floridanum TaxID=1325733 RepID=A0A428SLT0_9HYPO|nr:hypothetical protein CEP51_000600 [Fusarium floridanum]
MTEAATPIRSSQGLSGYLKAAAAGLLAVGRPVAAELGRRGTDTGSYGKDSMSRDHSHSHFFFNIHPQYDTVIPSPFSGSSDFSSEQGRLHLNDLLLSFANSADEQALASPADVCGVGGLAPEG